MKLGVIGFGNMGSAIVDGLLKKSVLTSSNIYACANNFDKLKERCHVRNINACKDDVEVARNSDVIIIATPAIFLLETVKHIYEFTNNKIVISVCSGYTFSLVHEHYPLLHFIQTIPSTPIRYAEGITVVENENNLTDNELDIFNKLFAPISLVKFVDTTQLDIASTIAGCGPAFAAMFVEALGDVGCKYGLSRDDAYSLASKMLVGLGTSYLESHKHPAILKDEVCSPNGSTIRGVTKLEECGFRNAIIKAIDEITNR